MSTASSRAPAGMRFIVGLAVLAALYFGRSVLSLLVLAATLAFVLAPLVRRFRRLGLGQAPAAVCTLVVAGVVMSAMGMVLVRQLSALGHELPAYEANLRDKAEAIRQVLLHPLRRASLQASSIAGGSAQADADAGKDIAATAPPAARSGAAGGGTADDPTERGLQSLQRFIGLVSGPIGAIGVVALVLVFTLFEQDALRDRLIRLLGGKDVRAATSAVNDAGQRLTRYFASQVTVNAGVAVIVGVLLALIGVPHAVIWAVLAGLLRFVPYVGFPAAAICACVMAAGAAPGWELVWMAAAMFAVVELVVANVLEPQLYGHATGLSPFSVVVAAIFWSALWGPVGLLLSTPLTLCLVVAGRHVPSLAFLDLLLGDAPALTLAQRFYQRVLSGDAVEIRADARRFLKQRSLAVYCDKVVVPAFEMARQDYRQQLITPEQQVAAQRVILEVFADFGHAPRRRPASRASGPVVADDLGLRVREQRVRAEGPWQGSLDVPAGSVLLCVSLSDAESHLCAELLVSVLRDADRDARHITVEELATPPEGAVPEAIGSVYIVSASAQPCTAQDGKLLQGALARLPHARLVTLLLERRPAADEISIDRPHLTAYSFVEAVALLRQERG